jgi:hypothetical protein
MNFDAASVLEVFGRVDRIKRARRSAWLQYL